MQGRITLKELAKTLSLSISTVSKALNDSPEISKDTKKRVKTVAEEHKYFPNSFAKSLKLQKTRTLGIVVPAILPNFFSMVLDGIEEKASTLGYRIIICISKESVIKEKQAIEMLIQAQVDGIIISPSRQTQANLEIEHLKIPENYGIPLLMFDRIIEEIKADKISIDDALEAELATLELFNSGCRKIAYVTGIPETSVNENRKKGYEKALEKYKLEKRIVEIDCQDYCYAHLEKILKASKIDAILTSDELTTVLTARNILKAGYRIPEDISLIGFTNGKMGENFLPSLSTIDQKAKEQGELAVHTIVDRIEGKFSEEALEFLLEAKIVHRESTKVPIST